MSALRTRLTSRLDVDVPVVQAPIGSATSPALDAAVSEAGGLGTLAVTWRDPARIPEVVAAGGIGDGRGLAAALALGADGAWVGTRFVATHEAHAHDRYRRRVVEATETETVSGTALDRG